MIKIYFIRSLEARAIRWVICAIYPSDVVIVARKQLIAKSETASNLRIIWFIKSHVLLWAKDPSPQNTKPTLGLCWHTKMGLTTIL